MSLTPYKGICPHCRSTDEQRGNMGLRGLSAGVTVDLPHIVEYRRKDSGATWVPMCAFDGQLVAERYADNCNETHAEYWEYRYIYLPVAAPSAAPAQNGVESVPVQPVAAVTPDHTLILYNDDGSIKHTAKIQFSPEPRGRPTPGACACAPRQPAALPPASETPRGFDDFCDLCGADMVPRSELAALRAPLPDVESQIIFADVAANKTAEVVPAEFAIAQGQQLREWQHKAAQAVTAWHGCIHRAEAAEKRSQQNLSEVCAVVEKNEALLSQLAIKHHALENLFALVNGECPGLLRDDHHYEMVMNALAAAPSASLPRRRTI